jgi:hypothetical protein
MKTKAKEMAKGMAMGTSGERGSGVGKRWFGPARDAGTDFPAPTGKRFGISLIATASPSKRSTGHIRRPFSAYLRNLRQPDLFAERFSFPGASETPVPRPYHARTAPRPALAQPISHAEKPAATGPAAAEPHPDRSPETTRPPVEVVGISRLIPMVVARRTRHWHPEPVRAGISVTAAGRPGHGSCRTSFFFGGFGSARTTPRPALAQPTPYSEKAAATGPAAAEHPPDRSPKTPRPPVEVVGISPVARWLWHGAQATITASRLGPPFLKRPLEGRDTAATAVVAREVTGAINHRIGGPPWS